MTKKVTLTMHPVCAKCHSDVTIDFYLDTLSTIYLVCVDCGWRCDILGYEINVSNDLTYVDNVRWPSVIRGAIDKIIITNASPEDTQ